MAGGNFATGVEKVRAGLYINFETKANENITNSERGIVALPIKAGWGTPKKFFEITHSSHVSEYFSYDISSPEMLPVREALKRSKTILVYRVNDGVKASVTLAPITATATIGGTLGNELRFVIVADPINDGKKIVRTFLRDKMVDEQANVINVSDLQSNKYVEFTGTGEIPETSGSVLTGGKDNAAVAQDYTDFLSACETQIFNVVAMLSDDDSLKAATVSFVKRLRDEEGMKVAGVVANHKGDYEGIINVKNGVVLEDGTQLSAVDAVAWVAGAHAGAKVTESLTYSVYEGAVDAFPRLKNSEIIKAIKAGEFLFMFDGAAVKVEKDINSLTTFTKTKNSRFSKNRVVRTLDTVANDLTKTFNESYIGKLDNSADGHAILTSAVSRYLSIMQTGGAIENFDPAKDFIINKELSKGDSLFADAGVQPIDSIEKAYFAVEVR